MTFYEILRFLIEERGLTQKQLAEALKIPVSTFGGYVQGTSEPDFVTLKIIAQYFNVSSDYLLDIQTGKTKTHMEDDLLRVFRSLSAEQQELFLEQGRVFIKLRQKNVNPLELI